MLCAGFEQAIQSYAIHVLSLTYQKVPRPVLAEVKHLLCLINVSSSSLSATILFSTLVIIRSILDWLEYV